MMTSSVGNIFRVTGLLWGDSTGHRWIPLTKAMQWREALIFLSAHDQTVEQVTETQAIWDAMTLMTSM